MSLFKAFETLQQNVFLATKIFVTKSLVFVSKDLLINKTHFVPETPLVKVLAAKNVITKSPICLKKKIGNENVLSLNVFLVENTIQ